MPAKKRSSRKGEIFKDRCWAKRWLDDPVVPPAQSESIAADLATHGIPYAYIAFEGESHGFRKAENIVASLEAELSFYGQIMGFTPPGVPPVPLC